ncbi:cytochrome b/b6 domain-containing protein [Tsuneonella amylolytica]|uniref:cytochrome b/b6 domain-containing protein n=1 Tax=Tsuneonella amylolytica TaxID=2338327 RepID=UPI000EA883E6|nr:cytochrome b/b6 domain-containing protein [Tsuneonella amylolytica]
MKRHALSTRLWHWVNLVCVVILFMSGLNISNAHPRLYWGKWGFDAADAWLIVPRFPEWSTIPGYYSLAGARDWHTLMVWPFALGLLMMWIAMLANRHFKRDLMTTREEWRWSAIRRDIAKHLRLDFHHEGSKLNFLQKLTYGLVLGVILPGMIVTGMGISPGMEPYLAPLIELVGGRQSMRSLHFICAWALFGFFVLHVVLVLLSHPLKQMRAMITGGRENAA